MFVDNKKVENMFCGRRHINLFIINTITGVSINRNRK